MFKSRKEADYTLNVGPYLPWVQAFGQLILEIYAEKKSVGKSWDAFRKTRPEFEHLDLASFEDILLLSLFRSEWNKLDETGNATREKTGSGQTDLQNKVQEQLDRVIQELRDVSEERDISLAAALQLEQKAQVLTAQKENLETMVQSLKAGSEKLDSELAAANERLDSVLHELDGIREENAVLKRERSVLEEKEASWPGLIQGLRAELDEARCEAAKHLDDEIEYDETDSAMIRKPSPGGTQRTLPWVPSETVREVRPQLSQGASGQVPVKKIGKWNAQLSKDGYYRLYRKIGGKVHSIYIGRRLDTEKAKEKIAEKERTLFAVK